MRKEGRLKKLILTVVFASLSSGWALAALINVTQPKAGECLTYGAPLKLKYSPNLPSKYLHGKILLLQHGQYVGTIASGIKLSAYVISGWWWDDAGSYIGGHALVGSEYSIRVATMDDAYWGDSGYFSIGGGFFLAPMENDNWELGSPKTIRWFSSGFPAGEKVNMRLMPSGGGPDYMIKGAFLNLSGGVGAWAWSQAGLVTGASAPVLVPPGKYYIVMASDVGRRITSKPFILSAQAYSFQVMKPLEGLHYFLSVPKPAQGLALKLGDPFKITWAQGQIPGYANVNIGLYGADKTTFLGTVDGKAGGQKANSGQFNATVLKAVFKAGQSYAIRVSTPDEKYVGFSGVFSVSQ
jgi:hypothetical protein